LQGQITEICSFFDEQLSKLFLKKISADQAIFEEELKIIKLVTLLSAEVQNNASHLMMTDIHAGTERQEVFFSRRAAPTTETRESQDHHPRH
jgi:hypothetical protein